jgi:4-aminobutyrate aminotransferase-like enzyme
LKDRNFLVGLGGAQKNVLRVMPPMCIKETDLDDFADALVKSCKRHSIQRFAGASS